MAASRAGDCPNCQEPLFRRSEAGDKLKIGRTPLVLHKGGDIEVNCPRCKHGVIVGRLDPQSVMRKASPRLHIRPRP